MGRPLRKDVLGVDAIGSPGAIGESTTGVRVEFYDGSTNQVDGVIIKQRGAKTFTVTRVGDIGTGSTYIKCVLQNSTPNAANEMRMWGWLGGNGGTEINIAKITKNLVTDFNQNKYTWTLENDSANDYIVLTAI